MDASDFAPVVDYMLTRREDRQLVRNVTVIQSEACIPQHKVMICSMRLGEKIRRRKEVFVSKCRVWKLKEKEGQRKFEAQIQAKADTRVDGDVESLWAKLKESLLAVADEVCGV